MSPTCRSSATCRNRCWSLFGTALLAVAGIRLPGPNFRNQRVEAAHRKELVQGEDDGARARPETKAGLFGQVSSSFQYLANSWTTIIGPLSIQERLRAFEAAFAGRGLPSADRARQNA